MVNKRLYTLLFVFFFGFSVFGQSKEITIDAIWKEYQFSPKGVRGFQFLPESDSYLTISATCIGKYDFATGTISDTLLSETDLAATGHQALKFKDIQGCEISKDEQCLLLTTCSEPLYRRSSKAFMFVYRRDTKTLSFLADTALGKQSFATLSPDGNYAAFVRNLNLYLTDLKTGIEVAITRDGNENHIREGIADWVYEEELSLSKAFEWSPDGSKIAFMRFDESHVKAYSFPKYGTLYPEQITYKYPKAGEENSVVSIFLYDVKTGEKQEVLMGDTRPFYFPALYWLPNSRDLIILKLDRHQQQLDFCRYNTVTRKQDIVFTEKDSCWIDLNSRYFFLEDNQSMLFTSERDGYNHVCRVEFPGKVFPLTRGKWEVAEICAVNSAKKQIYYLSNESAPLNRDLYVVDFNGKNKKRLSNGKGWHGVSFSSGTHYYLDIYSDHKTPPVYRICKDNGEEIRELQDNRELNERIAEYGYVEKEFLEILSAKEDVTLHGWMLKPPTFNPNKKYPVLMYTYGGPGSQEVNNSWSRSFDYAWYQMLAQKGYIVVCVDGRGTAGQGATFKKCIYRQMGKLESDDQIAVACYLRALPYVDSTRVGIWGWSFGGYLAALSMFKSEGLFKMAIAVAPVTDWRYYDNIYTERFLQTPRENPDGYTKNSPLHHAHKLKGHFLLIHGTADDNVHFQNTADLVTALIRADKQFAHFIYPNMNHFIYEGNARHHLYTMLTNYILENL
jgi:dipeptidyl-peptidase-4